MKIVMTHSKKLHKIQKQIIKELTTKPSLRFSELDLKFVDSEQLSYHIRRLIDKGYIVKVEDKYTLTDFGKDYCSLTDDNIEELERQPKTSVVIYVSRINQETNEEETLVCKRLRHPYFGKVGRIGGKVRFGEKLEDAVKRELKEETGLISKDCGLERIYRKMRKNQFEEFIQDVIFYIFSVTEFTGEIIDNIGIQENFWLSKTRFKTDKTLDLYDDFEFSISHKNNLEVIESIDMNNGF